MTPGQELFNVMRQCTGEQHWFFTSSAKRALYEEAAIELLTSFRRRARDDKEDV